MPFNPAINARRLVASIHAALRTHLLEPFVVVEAVHAHVAPVLREVVVAAGALQPQRAPLLLRCPRAQLVEDVVVALVHSLTQAAPKTPRAHRPVVARLSLRNSPGAVGGV